MKIKKYINTGIKLRPGMVFNISELNEKTTSISGNVYFDFTKTGEIELMAVDEREETEEEKKKREQAEARELVNKEKKEKDLLKYLTEKYEKTTE